MICVPWCAQLIEDKSQEMTNLIRIVFYLLMLFFAFDVLFIFHTKIQEIKSALYFGALLLPIPILIMELILSKNWNFNSSKKVFPLISIFWIIYINPFWVYHSTKVWETVEVQLIDEDKPNHKVEFQERNSPEYFYSNRRTEVYYLSENFYLIFSENFDENNIVRNRYNWKKVGSFFDEKFLNDYRPKK